MINTGHPLKDARKCITCQTEYVAQLSYRKGEDIESSGERCPVCFKVSVQPRDANGAYIAVNDFVLFPVAQGGRGNAARIRFGKVVEITVPYFGNGGFNRTLKIRPMDAGDDKIFSHPYPKNCIKVSPAGTAFMGNNFQVNLDDETNAGH